MVIKVTEAGNNVRTFSIRYWIVAIIRVGQSGFSQIEVSEIRGAIHRERVLC